MKTNLEIQLPLLREGFWLTDFYFLALPCSDSIQTDQHLVR